MMGFAHSLSGAAAWLAGAPLIAAATNTPLTMSQYALGALAVAGAAVAPDLDHPAGTSSASRSLPPVTTVMGKVVSVIGFGHRKATHSLLGVAVVTVVAALLIGNFGVIAPAVLAFFLAAFALKALKVAKFLHLNNSLLRWVFTAIVSGAFATAVALQGGDYKWLLVAFSAGFFIHIVGDAITMSGVPWLWPYSRDFRLARLAAGGTTERVILTPVFIIIIAFSIFSVVKDGEVMGNPVPASSAPVTAKATAQGDLVEILPKESEEPKPEKKKKKDKKDKK